MAVDSVFLSMQMKCFALLVRVMAFGMEGRLGLPLAIPVLQLSGLSSGFTDDPSPEEQLLVLGSPGSPRAGQR